jgi:hypothetical protein
MPERHDAARRDPRTDPAPCHLKNGPHTIIAEIEVGEDGGHGVILEQLGRFVSWSLNVTDGVVAYAHNFFGGPWTRIEAPEPLRAGRHRIRYDFAYEGGGIAGGGRGLLSIDDVQVGDGRLNATLPFVFSGDETLLIGLDSSWADRRDEVPGTAFNGTIHLIQIDIGNDGAVPGGVPAPRRAAPQVTARL